MDWTSIFRAADSTWGERAPLLILALAFVGGIIWLSARFLRDYQHLQERQDKRDEETAERERASLEALSRLTEPVIRIPSLLEAQGRRLDELAAAQSAGFRQLAEEIRETGRSAREAWRESMTEIRDMFRRGNHRA